MSKKDRGNSQRKTESGRKWKQPKKWRSRKTREPSKPQEQRVWMEDLLDTQMILTGGAA